jgi:hypothetical protein
MEKTAWEIIFPLILGKIVSIPIFNADHFYLLLPTHSLDVPFPAQGIVPVLIFLIIDQRNGQA